MAQIGEFLLVKKLALTSKDATGSAMAGLMFLSVLLVASFLLTMALRVGVERPAAARVPA